MFYKKNKKFKKNKNLKKEFLFPFLLIGYSFALIWVGSNKNYFSKNLKDFIPLGTRQVIKDSIPYQMYQSGFRVNVISNAINGAFKQVDPIILDIKFEEFEKLQKKRLKAIEKDILVKSDEDYVKAYISDSTKKIKAKIRLKGDWVDHLQSNKWSYRVKIREENMLLGMNKFSLQSPVTRNYIWEWLFHELLRYEGLPSLRYYFRPLIVNGNHRGIYAIEEHFDKILLESNGFKEAPIIKFSEDLFWESRHKIGYRKSFSTGFKLKKIFKNPVLNKNFTTANKLLNGFHDGILETSEVFDIDFLAKYFAIVDLVNAHHASEWHNIRFYFDPFQSKLIPIGFDGEPNESLLDVISLEKNDAFRKSLFKDNSFRKLYLKNLNRVSKKEYLDKFLKQNKKEFDNNKNILYKSFPALDTDTDNFYLNQLKIRSKLEPLTPINSFLDNLSENKITIDVANNQLLPIELIGIKIDNSVFDLKNKLILNGIDENQNPIYKKIEISVDNLIPTQFEVNKKISVIYRVYGLSKLSYAEINPFDMGNPIQPKKYFFDLSDIYRKSFLIVNDKEKKITIKKGKWIIKKPLIIPKGYVVHANSGVKINLEGKGYILSYSPIIFRGDKENPIEINNFNKTPGNGFALIKTDGNSVIDNVIFRNISNIENERFIFTGAVTFYDSPINITNSFFYNGMAEDSLNIVRSNFIIKNSKFKYSESDSIDIDFSNGQVENVEIYDSMNDGLDISGSIIQANNVSIRNSKDKGLSIGEGSSFYINKLKIDNSYVAIANKDGSFAKIDNVEIYDSIFDFIGFNKKNEYKGSNTKINFLTTKNNEFNYLLANPSSLMMNNISYNANSENDIIWNLIYK